MLMFQYVSYRTPPRRSPSNARPKKSSPLPDKIIDFFLTRYSVPSSERTQVPLVLESVSTMLSARRSTRQCTREAKASSRTRSQEGSRPSVIIGRSCDASTVRMPWCKRTNGPTGCGFRLDGQKDSPPKTDEGISRRQLIWNALISKRRSSKGFAMLHKSGLMSSKILSEMMIPSSAAASPNAISRAWSPSSFALCRAMPR